MVKFLIIISKNSLRRIKWARETEEPSGEKSGKELMENIVQERKRRRKNPELPEKFTVFSITRGQANGLFRCKSLGRDF